MTSKVDARFWHSESAEADRETAEMGKMGEKREEDDSACKANANRKLKGGRR